MRIFLTGGSGFLGNVLMDSLQGAGHSLTILTRSRKGTFPDQAPGMRWIEGDPAAGGEWQSRLREHDAVVNLAGAPIFTRWTSGARRRILESRVLLTRRIVESLEGGRGRLSLILNASAVGYYGFHGDEELTEEDPPGCGFLSDVSQAWEEEASRARAYGVRVILCRFGVILGTGGGALAHLVSLFRLGAGARLGKGDQWMSWIHAHDAAAALKFLIDDPGSAGPVNVTAPQPVTNAELTRELLSALHRRSLLPPVPGWVLRVILGEFSDTLLRGQKVTPARLLAQGYSFDYPEIKVALAQLLAPSERE
jgi:uncharacterized protein (TIGR01777 family)